MKLLLAFVLIVAALLFVNYGTIEPCGILRHMTRDKDRTAALLPDSWIDAALELKYGPLSPGRCTVVALGLQDAAPHESSSSMSTDSRGADALGLETSRRAVLLQQVKAVEADCRNRRLSGELKTYQASADCSNPQIIELFKSANYPSMDLIGQFTLKREQTAIDIDAGKITEEEGNAEMTLFTKSLAVSEKARDPNSP